MDAKTTKNDYLTIFDSNDPEKKVPSLNHLNQPFMIKYLGYQIEKGNKEKVAAYAAATQGKSLKEKKRIFALEFMPYLLKDNKLTFEERLANLLKE